MKKKILIVCLMLCALCTAQQNEPRHPKRLIPVIAAATFEAAAGYYDNHETVIGLRHQVAYEGYTWLCGNRPNFGCVERRDILQLGFTVTPSVLGWVFRKSLFSISQSGDPAVLGVMHIRGGDAWRKLLRGSR